MTFDYINSSKYGSTWSVSNNTYISDGVVIDVDNINILNKYHEVLILKNTGTISGMINVCSGCHLYIENTGRFNSNFNLSGGAEVTQIISSADSVTDLHIDSNFNILVDSADDISLSDLFSISRNAGTIIFNNSSFILDTDFKNTSNIRLIGENTLYIDKISNFDGTVLLEHVIGDGTIYVHANDLNPLFVLRTSIKNGNVIADTVRETDYEKIYKNDLGKFLNLMRNSGRDDLLFSKLDTALSFEEIDSILKLSVRTNPAKLLDSIKFINFLQLYNSDIFNKDSGLSLEPLFVYGKSVQSYGGKVNINYNFLKRFSFNGSLYGLSTKVKDDFNDYDTTSYGANVTADYEINWFRVRGLFGLNESNFSVGSVFLDDEIIYDPKATSMYLKADVGVPVNIDKAGLKVIPFIGFEKENFELLNLTESLSAGFVGLETLVSTEVQGIKYDYGIDMQINTGGFFKVGLSTNFWSVFDRVGGTLKIAAIKNLLGFSGEVSVNAKIAF